MGHKKNFFNLGLSRVKKMEAFGESRFKDKQKIDRRDFEKIYSYQYQKNLVNFCKNLSGQVKGRHKSLEDFKPLIVDKINQMVDSGQFSNSTLSTYKSFARKLFQDKNLEFKEHDDFKRSQITRGRHINESKFEYFKKHYVDLNFISENSGLRAHELKALKQENLYFKNGEPKIFVEQGKGGKSREVTFIGDRQKFSDLMGSRTQKLLFEKVPKNNYSHHNRREYTKKLYDRLARPMDQVPKNERYIFRNDLKGQTMDKQAMAVVSKNLGHTRIDVIAKNYVK